MTTNDRYRGVAVTAIAFGTSLATLWIILMLGVTGKMPLVALHFGGMFAACTMIGIMLARSLSSETPDHDASRILMEILGMMLLAFPATITVALMLDLGV